MYQELGTYFWNFRRFRTMNDEPEASLSCEVVFGPTSGPWPSGLVQVTKLQIFVKIAQTLFPLLHL